MPVVNRAVGTHGNMEENYTFQRGCRKDSLAEPKTVDRNEAVNVEGIIGCVSQEVSV